MSEPLVYVDASDVRDGKTEELKAAIGDLAALVERTQPQLVAYLAQLTPDGNRLSVIHVHRDSASLDRYVRETGPAFARFRELVTLRRIDLYGDPSDEALERMHDKARLLGAGAAAVTVHPTIAGFARLLP